VGSVEQTVTPQELARELGISAKTLRQWLRDQGWQSVPYTRWQLTPDQAALARQHFSS
jgi:uncharacterized protein YjcR